MPKGITACEASLSSLLDEKKMLLERVFHSLSPFLICITCAETAGAVQQLGLGMQYSLLPLLLSLELERR